jgi:LacI family transcriptional regulator
MKRTTIRDIARAANVSVATVSAVINGKPSNIRISEETRERVLQVCRETNYSPNVHARRLARNRAETVAFLTPPPGRAREMHLFGAMLTGIQEELARRRYSLILEMTTVEFLQEQRYMRWVRDKSVDGVMAWALDDRHPIISDLVKTGMPLVFIGSKPAGDRIPYVKSDERKGASQAVRYLIENGRRLIAHIAGPFTSDIGRERYEGYREEIARSIGEMPAHYLRLGDFTEASGYECMKDLLRLSPRPDAVFAGNDHMAYGAMMAIEEAGLHIPDDIAVVGADDTELARLIRPALTTVRLPMREMGALAAKKLLRLLDNAPDQAIGDVLPVELVVRKSSGKAAGQLNQATA